ncbi:MAG: DUF6538 domain-containing protein [Pseudomonadota bacterium]
MDCEYLTQRGLYWHYVRRVPVCFAHLDPRKFVRVSTRKKSQSEALIIADRINKETEAFWQSLLTHQDQAPQSLETYSQAIECARFGGFIQTCDGFGTRGNQGYHQSHSAIGANQAGQQ